ncbi:discoidin domain-containing protein [Lentisphaera marina]|uniref:discoidin domain-containing protein n=1 Tax=Lentisphaera marina TaxID=1111041 RepID=UPI0023661B9E|nr:discoidin domain-containing protein [Lentisphaera marina]MDD7983942.1 discoidin domain-containing protein [Lentisphaera marina]
MNYLYYVLIFIFSVSVYSETGSVIAESDMKKGEQIDATPAFDGDIETMWSESFNKKMSLFIVLSEQKTIEALEIIWGDEFAKEIQLELKVKGGWKGPDKIEGKQNSDATYFNLDTKRNSKFIRISFKANESPKLITIKEIKINGEASTLSTLKNTPRTQHGERQIKEQTPVQLSKPQDKLENVPDSDKASGDQPIRVKKSANKIYI